ncbi:MAG: Holliday junction resolvase RuvX [Clostridia bacterium]|nr:Holliday junction resolvase RuvX [Clostridia bacterium]
MAAVMGIDYGDSRIGIAVSDGLGIVATPRCIVDGRKSLAETVAAIGGIYEAEKCDTVVIGYPINMDGSYGNRIHRTEKFIEKFSESYPDANIIRQDERLTTKSADRAMIDMGVSQRRKGISDMIAAQIILQSYLDKARG